MLHYIKAFPETLHHPKEDAYLFRKLRARTREFDATLDELERQHVEGHALVEELERSIARLRGGSGKAACRAFAAAVERFATSQMQHMALEAKVIIPGRAEASDRRGLGGDRRRFRRQRRSALLGRQRRGVPRSCSRGS